jgi:hypothetical protein
MPEISQAVCVQNSAQGEAWRYAFSLGAVQSAEDIRISFSGGAQPWTGLFECARNRQMKVLQWPEASSIVVAASNALYIVDPSRPQQFRGFVAPVEINDLTFDESGRHLFVAESLRIHAYSADRNFLWISEPLDGYGARFAGCHGRVLLVEIKQSDRAGEYESSSQIRLRTEDGTILRSRFRLAQRHKEKSVAA